MTTLETVENLVEIYRKPYRLSAIKPSVLPCTPDEFNALLDLPVITKKLLDTLCSVHVSLQEMQDEGFVKKVAPLRWCGDELDRATDGKLNVGELIDEALELAGREWTP